MFGICLEFGIGQWRKCEQEIEINNKDEDGKWLKIISFFTRRYLAVPMIVHSLFKSYYPRSYSIKKS